MPQNDFVNGFYVLKPSNYFDKSSIIDQYC